MVNIVARLEMSQDDQIGTDILVYTLVNKKGDWKLTFPAKIKQMVVVMAIETMARQSR